MPLRLASSSPGDEPPQLAERFWSLVPPPRPGGEPVEIVEHLLAILHRFRVLERVRSADPSIAPLSLGSLLRQNEARGDFAYASPEQLAGAGGGSCAQVFSVGVLLFERLCHRHPFGADRQPLQMVRLRRAELGSSVNYLPRLPASLRTVLTRSLSPLPEERYPSVDALAEDLRTFAAAERRVPRLPGAPPARTEEAHVAAPSDAMRARPVSEWERMPTDAGDDELAAPSLEDVLLGDLAPAPTGARPTARGTQPPAHPVAADAPVPSLRQPSRARRLVLGLAAAAGIAAAAFAIGKATSGGGEAPAAALAGAPEQPPETEEPAPAEAVAPEVESLGASFAPDELADAALAAVVPCFADRSRPAVFGLGVLFQPGATLAQRVFTPREPQLEAERLACVRGRLLGVTAAAPPERSSVLELRFSIAETGHSVELVRLQE